MGGSAAVLAEGPPGETGPQGEQGPAGPRGPQGDTGDTGPQGEAGANGPAGAQGETGLTGPAGAAGPQGVKGDTGDVGPQGIQGLTGPQGTQGPQGPTGPAGEAGASGQAGPAGPQGNAGSQGPQGIQGPEGPAGPAGTNGTNGTNGIVPSVFALASDAATGANVTPISLTGLVFTYAVNSVYRLWFMGRVSAAAATTGCGFQFDLSSVVTAIDVQFFHQLANTGTLSSGHSIADDASVGVSSGLPATSTYPITGFGLLVTGANTGTAQLRFRSETTAVITARAGFRLIVEKVA